MKHAKTPNHPNTQLEPHTRQAEVQPRQNSCSTRGTAVLQAERGALGVISLTRINPNIGSSCGLERALRTNFKIFKFFKKQKEKDPHSEDDSKQQDKATFAKERWLSDLS